METFEEKQKRQERESKRTGAIVTGVIHSIIILFLVVTMAWLPPDPPIPRYGIEVDLGVGFEGFGDIENATNPKDSESLEEAKPNPKPEQADPVPVKPTPVPEVSTPKPNVTPVQAEAEKAVVVPEKVEATKPKPTETAKTETAPVKPSSADGAGKADTDLASNQGKAEGKVGDAGQANGNINADAVLGGGSGGGAHLNLDGWKWDAPPTVKDASTEIGNVTVQFKIDDEGTVVSAKVVAGYTVSPGVAEFYRSYVEREMSFTPKSGGKVPSYTLGSITFIIKTK